MGLSCGIVPSLFMRRILPITTEGSCANGCSVASPTVIYNLSSGPNANAPPAWYPWLAGILSTKIVHIFTYIVGFGESDNLVKRILFCIQCSIIQ